MSNQLLLCNFLQNNQLANILMVIPKLTYSLPPLRFKKKKKLRFSRTLHLSVLAFIFTMSTKPKLLYKYFFNK